MTPFFLTVDTEGDNIWEKPNNITSINTTKLYRFQNLCEMYNIKPIYLTNYEACINPQYQKFIELHKDNLEVGLHLHAWNSPPNYKLTENDYLHQPYLHEYPSEIIEEKINFMVKLLKDTFKINIISHRGGRYSINSEIFQILLDNGIQIDCSVVPGIDWSSSMGDPDSLGGPNFKDNSSEVNYIYKNMLEIPVSTYRINKYIDSLETFNFLKKVLSKACNYKTSILRSKVSNLQELKKIVNWNLKNKNTHLEYIIHSSELMEGFSPLISSKKEEEIFYENLELFFKFLKTKPVVPLTFKEYLNKDC